MKRVPVIDRVENRCETALRGPRMDLDSHDWTFPLLRAQLSFPPESGSNESA